MTRNHNYVSIFVILFFMLLLMPYSSLSFAETYYIDSSYGDDSIDGKSETTPWKTLRKVNEAQELASGDTILFKRGEKWRGQLIPMSGNEIDSYTKYGAYGSGNKPQLLGSITRNSESEWNDEGGNIWSTKKPTPMETEFITNGNFDDEDYGWDFWYEDEDINDGIKEVVAYGSIDTSDYHTAPASYKIFCEKKYDENSNDNKKNYIQFFTIEPITITFGSYYQLTFFAKSSTPFDIDDITLTKRVDPWTPYFSSKSPNSRSITTNWSEYKVFFKAQCTERSECDENDARITFYLGIGMPEGSTLNIDSVSLKEFNENDILDVDVGNLIFKGGESCGIKVWGSENADHLNQPGEFWYDEENLIIKMYLTENPAIFYNSSIECAMTRNIIDEGPFVGNIGKSYIIYENLDLRYGGAHGIGGTNVHDIIIRNCDLSYIGGGILQFINVYGEEEKQRYGNGIEFFDNSTNTIVEGCRIWEVYDAGLTTQGDGRSSMTDEDPDNIICHKSNQVFRNNIIRNCEYCFEFWNRPEVSTSRDIVFENNTCIDSGYGWGHTQRRDPSGKHLCFFDNPSITSGLSFRNNIFYRAKRAAVSFELSTLWREWSGLKDFVLDYNCYYQNNKFAVLIEWPEKIVESNEDEFWTYKKFTGAEFQNYQSETGKDKNSFYGDPLFSENSDYHIISNSPCIDAGAADGAPDIDIDGDSRPQGSDYDIGADEYNYCNHKILDVSESLIFRGIFKIQRNADFMTTNELREGDILIAYQSGDNCLNYGDMDSTEPGKIECKQFARIVVSEACPCRGKDLPPDFSRAWEIPIESLIPGDVIHMFRPRHTAIVLNVVKDDQNRVVDLYVLDSNWHLPFDYKVRKHHFNQSDLNTYKILGYRVSGGQPS